MKRDFTLSLYRTFLKTALSKGYYLTTFKDFISNNHHHKKVMILRHDVDTDPGNSLKTAMIQHDLGVKGSYYFRIVPSSFDTHYIQKIRDLGHEIGYHYEDMTIARGDISKAINLFRENLMKIRRYYPVETICMHGSPLSKWDNRELWKQYDYKEFGILAEPYFDLDFHKVLYITDTGRSWNNIKASIRDNVNSSYKYSFKSTYDLIEALKKNNLPPVIMQNIHPERWHDNLYKWSYHYLTQNVKNQAKKLLKKYRT